MRRSIALAGLLACICLQGGCNQPARPPESPRAVEKKYDLSITLDLRDAGGAEEYYVVERDGVLGFGGGMNARFQRIVTTIQLEPEDMQQLRDVIERERLLSQPLESTHQPKDARYRIDVHMDRQSVNKSIKGTNPRIEELRSVLKEFANRRLGEDLDRQPRPSAATQPATTQPASP